jgi:hypothetical protein
MKYQWTGAYFRVDLTGAKDGNEYIVTKMNPLFPMPSIYSIFVLEVDVEHKVHETAQETT